MNLEAGRKTIREPGQLDADSVSNTSSITPSASERDDSSITGEGTGRLQDFPGISLWYCSEWL